MSKEEIEDYLKSAIDEIEYSIKIRKTKSEIVRQHYLENAITYIQMAQEKLMKENNIGQKKENS